MKLTPASVVTLPPLQKTVPAVPFTLQQIGRFIAADDADPIGAVMLYLIVFHLATVQELRYLRLPTVISLATRQNTFHLSIETALALPKRQASLGIMHPGRPGGVIRFHRSVQPWLPRLLARFEQKCTAVIGPHGKSRYVFGARRGALRDTPVCPVWRAGAAFSDTGISGFQSGHYRREIHAKTET